VVDRPLAAAWPPSRASHRRLPDSAQAAPQCDAVSRRLSLRCSAALKPNQAFSAMCISGDSGSAARRVLKLLMFDETSVAGPSGSESWMLRFRVAETESDGYLLQSVHVRCVSPNDVVEFSVSDGESETFAVRTQVDSWGRACTSGAMLLAMYGLDDQGGLQVPAAEFDRPIRSDRAVVQLQVQGPGARSLECVAVSAGPCDRATPCSTA
jgi:hypothetical protein